MSDALMRRAARRAKDASYILGSMPAEKRNAALLRIADCLVEDSSKIVQANAKDVAAAEKAGLTKAMVARLALDEKKIAKIAQGSRDIASLEDPLNRLLEKIHRPNGLVIDKVSVPLGVLLIIYESRPNVTADCAGLGIKSGNAVILKGGSEAFHSNRAIHASIVRALKKTGLPEGAVEWVASTDRKDVHALLKMNDLIDVVIPRGGEALIRKVAEDSRIPVIKHYKGVCHVFVDKDADLSMALKIAENAKVQNPGVCNAMETLLVHKDVAKDFLEPFGRRMKEKGVELRGDAASRAVLKGIKKATEGDWSAEYLDLILAVRVVGGLDEAIGHIRKYGSAHSDSIVTKNSDTANAFTRDLDSACVFVNASTRFNDGGEFGMGAEIGISTDKLHARGPMGLRELTTYKYIVRGNGQIRG